MTHRRENKRQTRGSRQNRLLSFIRTQARRYGKRIAWNLLGSMILAFGYYHVHATADITEGGVLGLTLLGEYWLGISPAATNFVLTAICYTVGWRTFGKDFLVCSAAAAGGFSLFYAVFEQFRPVWPGIADHPLVAALAGAVFVGVGVGLCVRAGGAPTGDDALAMSLSKRTAVPIQWIYLISDLSVLGCSATYLPLRKLLFSLLTVVLSGQIIGWIAPGGWKKTDGTRS